MSLLCAFAMNQAMAEDKNKSIADKLGISQLSKKSFWNLPFFRGLNSGNPSLAENNDANKEPIKWTDASDLVKYHKDTHASAKDMQDTIMQTFEITKEEVEKEQTEIYTDPTKQLFSTAIAMRYIKEHSLWRSLPFHWSSRESFSDLCLRTRQALQKALWSNDFSSANISALMQNFQLCQEKNKQELERIRF